jgi:hypothetical protein
MRTATVSAPVATLWAKPDAPRPGIDAAALAEQSDPSAWVSGMDGADRIYYGVLTQLMQGEPVLIEEISGGWARVVATAQPAARLDPRGYPGWMPVGQLRFDDVLEVAREWIGTPYVWGGLTKHGIDCSGLVHLAFRRAGQTLPRDASDQALVTAPVPAGQERPGDLYFFSDKPDRITHVGFVTGPGRMLHACGEKGRVVEEELPENRQRTLVAVHRAD